MCRQRVGAYIRVVGAVRTEDMRRRTCCCLVLLAAITSAAVAFMISRSSLVNAVDMLSAFYLILSVRCQFGHLGSDVRTQYGFAVWKQKT
jgi:hypothetical protein